MFFFLALLLKMIFYLTIFTKKIPKESLEGIRISSDLKHIVSICIQRCLCQFNNEHTVRAAGLTVQLRVCNPALLLTCVQKTKDLIQQLCLLTTNKHLHQLTSPKDFKSFLCWLDLNLSAPSHIHVVILIFTQYFRLGRSEMWNAVWKHFCIFREGKTSCSATLQQSSISAWAPTRK